jgi:GGDEF domain-containing protein
MEFCRRVELSAVFVVLRAGIDWLDSGHLTFSGERRKNSLLRCRGALEKRVVEAVLDYEDLYGQARRDILTGLANRRGPPERLGGCMESARRHGHPVTLASMDLYN